VLTYNIHAGKDAQGKLSIPAIAAVIDSLQPDIVMLQEVDRRTKRASGEDHLAQLAALTKLNAAFAKSLDYDGGDYGIALLSRWPIDSSTVVSLAVEPPQERSGGSHEPRVGLHAVLRAPFGRLDVVNAHIDPAREGTYRKQEVIGLLARVQRNIPPDAPLIFGGDLNTRPNTDEIAAVSLALTDAWAACGTGPGYTFNAAAPDRRIDYVFYRRARCLHVRIPETQASDHRPLFVTLEFSRRP
ncbi:MAG TPA: endonuclease/exonuclease/phosphatase family protein, partial [Longimicrobiales bacterium]|nr:endonuclease/exonuclease/phosphatase family protein [Longimicrobiales bacterium]